MTVPTGAIYDWRYDEGYVPRTSSPGKPGIEHPVEVISRTIVDPADPANAHGTSAVWRYNYGAFNAHTCETLTTYPFGRAGSVVKPDGTVDVNYYSLQDKQPCDVVDQFNNTWDRNDLGLPFTKGVTLSIPLNSPPNANGTYLNVGPADGKRPNPTDSTDIQYLSSQTYSATGALLRSRYVRYEGDSPRSEGTRPNARAVTETSYQEDATCGSS